MHGEVGRTAKESTEIERLLAENRTAIRIFINSRLRDKWLVEDILQETLLTCFVKFGTLRDENRFLPWAIAIAKNLLIHSFKRHYSEDDFYDIEQIPNGEMEQIEYLFHKQKMEAILAILRQLPDTQKNIAIEYYIFGVERERICKKYGIKKTVFDARLFRARKYIRKFLSKRHGNKDRLKSVNNFCELTKGEYKMDEIRIEISWNMIDDLIKSRESDLLSNIRNIRSRFEEDFAISIPKVHVIDNEHLKNDEYIISIDEKRIQDGTLESSDKLAEITEIFSEIVGKTYIKNNFHTV